ncbi:MAG: hypothetical protein JWP60_2454 [Ramlibacter sp.]|nr:hypothetical protein [Ramlibacter sp.]
MQRLFSRAGIAAPILSCVAVIAGCPGGALAHGFVGQRFFPATLATDDPFVADELSLPTVSVTHSEASADAPAGKQTAVSIDVSKRITDDLGISFGSAWNRFHFADGTRTTGFDNSELGLKYQFYRNEAAEALVSAGISWEIGGSGSRSLGVDRFSTYTPTIFFGKGFGNLPVDALRPLAVTGTAGLAIPSRSSTTTTAVDPDTGLPATQVQRNPDVLRLGLSLQYSIPYLQSMVKDTGLGAPWNRMIPVVEIAAARPVNRVEDRSWTGTVNPGVLWVGQKVQVGLEAVLPMNHASGRGVGWLVQLHFFLDDIFPNTIGRPLISASR